ncbi:MAG: hypothetical protein H6636_06910 [Anaerolineales bacterium]|nr:hypothetical protein [Anaerolineales bacterium]
MTTSTRISLTTILDDLVRRAKNATGFPARQTLKNGLRVDVLVLNYETGESETFLQLFRPNTYPSHQEWMTVLKNWPYPRVLATPYLKLSPPAGGLYLKGSWPTPVEPEQKKLFSQE